ncbi:LysR substrate-binding domain-containing protein [Methylobacterium aerolatum]|uniref:DNA-binding transcriptional LysR family regulator n=1 Tax=Methylobacterium aerolatum TaxID=418708 RepID=A0ABU0I2D2_9HYPH|nr:LysR substrate-binding domain-containing protein [Methylobacterium aerolatum]MDQ0448755.1 DNA-binding transcriptional LysR family regulator [Methylobacterium aerolatum]GJD34027.1 HTH-type transcriptional regulator TrpI [Methylobacterium aerolatum]
MSHPRLPLNALRAFEATARLGSMSAAATELGVTHGAISRHVRGLEAQFGLPLLERGPRAVAPTREGARLADELGEAFARMHLAVSQLQPGPLTLSCSATVMMRWLIPRLEGFKRANPAIDLRLNISYGNVDFIRDEISVAIRNSMYHPPPNAVAETVIREEIGPVCHPDYAARHGIATIDDLARARILGCATRLGGWSEWTDAVGRRTLGITPHEVFGHFYLVIQAAACGLGFALAPRLLVADEIRAGHLVAPLGFAMGPHSLQLWIADHLRTRADLRSVVAWLRSELSGGQPGSTVQ